MTTRARAEQGLAEWTHAAGRVLTLSTFTCCHCNTVTVIEARAKPDDCGGFCLGCMKPTCRACADKGCTPFEKRLERYEAKSAARARLLASMGL